MTIAHYNTIPHLKHGRITIPLDEHSYASILANIIRAKQCIYKNNIKEYYDKDHWTMLMLYYINALDIMKKTFPEAFKSVPLKDYYELMGIYRTRDIECRGMWICHTTCLKNDIEILEYTVIAASAIQTILEQEYKYRPETIARIVASNLETSNSNYNENFTKKYTK